MDPSRICSRGYWDPAKDHPRLLELQEEVGEDAGADWSRWRGGDGSNRTTASLDQLIREELFLYAKRNMALVNVYIKDPVVTRIKRDQKIPLIGFVANTGGLLGLCMGFSLVSAFEIVYHCVLNCCKR